MAFPNDKTPHLSQGSHGVLDDTFTLFQTYTVLEPTRLDLSIAAQCPLWTRAQLKRVIDAGAVQVNQKTCTKPAQKLSPGDRVTYPMPSLDPEAPPKPEDGIKLDILYQDDDLFVIDKPSGLVVHPGAGNPHHTLVNALLSLDPAIARIGDPMRPGIVHRLDAPTSGLLLVARSPRAYDALTDMFARHDIHRQYWAICLAPKLQDHGTFDTPYGRHPTQRVKYSSRFDAPKRAITHFTTVDRNAQGFALVTCLLETGRTHQVRVHLSEHGAPILGDDLYAPAPIARHKAIPRLALHAQHLTFNHPISNTPCSFSSPFPEDFSMALQKLGLHLPPNLSP